jgi:hypothetical protein
MKIVIISDLHGNFDALEALPGRHSPETSVVRNTKSLLPLGGGFGPTNGNLWAINKADRVAASAATRGHLSSAIPPQITITTAKASRERKR